ncbi:MAG: flagellar hook-basal body protein [Candidatus Lambdaproteobacteria bacterium]|nr:flagellar hook-basal body protein [Candidatus Lambdaproteobacteria bacterium]
MNPQGIYSLVSQGHVLQRQMEAVSNNLANADTTGYKGDQAAFETVFARTMGIASESDEERFAHSEHLPPYSGIGTHYVTVGDMGKNFAEGRLVRTGNDLDFALANPAGFFSVNTPQGERFTRAGTFRLSKDNQLISAEGYTVNGKEGPLKIVGQNVQASEDGTIIADGRRVGGMKVVAFPFPERLQKLGNSLFAPVDAENQPRILEDVQMVQGSIESSNVEVVKEMVRMIEANRAYTQMQKALRAADDMNRGAISLAQV